MTQYVLTNSFNSSPSQPDQRFAQWKGSKWFSYFFSLPLSLFMHYLCVLLSCFWVSPILYYALFNMVLFVCFQFCFILFFIKKNKKLKNQENTKTVCVLCRLVLVYLWWPLKQNFLNFVSFVTSMSISMHN